MRFQTIGLLGIAWLISSVLIGCGGKGSEPASSSDSTSSIPTAVSGDNALTRREVVFPEGQLKIVWVNMDSLLNNYDYYFAQQQEMRNLASSAEADMQKQAKSFEQRMTSFTDRAQKGLMTRSEMQKEQESLQAEQGRLLQLQEQHRAQLMEEEQVRTRKVMAAISEYIEKYNAEHGYDYILSGPILYGHPALNITRDVLEGLNSAYSSSRSNAASK